MREFESGATRSSNGGKIEYFGFMHPKLDLSYGKYMMRNQKQEDGNMRASDNWWKGWDKKISLQSMARHVEDLKALYSGHIVVKVKNHKTDIETTYYLSEGETIADLTEDETYETPTEEDCCNAIRFNSDSYKLQIIK